MAVQTTPMLTVRCPHCNRAVAVDPHGDNDTVVCPLPDCGKPFQVDVPNAPQVPAAAAPAPAALAPETVVQTIHVAMVRRYPFRVAGYGLAGLALIALAVYLFIAEWTLFGWVAAAVAVLALGKLLLWWLRMRHTMLTITSRRLILETGVISRQATEFDLDDLAEVLVYQNFGMRLCDVGDLTLVSVGGNTKRQVVVMAVPDVEGVAALVRDQREIGRQQPKPPPA